MLQTVDKTRPNPFGNVLKAMGFLPEKYASPGVRTQTYICMHTPISLASLLCRSFRGVHGPSKSHPQFLSWEPIATGNLKRLNLSTLAFAKEEELLSSFHVHERASEIYVKTDAHPTNQAPHVHCFRSLSSCTVSSLKWLSLPGSGEVCN